MNYFDELYKEENISFIFLGKSGAGLRDMNRLYALFPRANFYNRGIIGLLKTIITPIKNENIVYIHSSPWNIIHAAINYKIKNYLIAHNPANFISRMGIFGAIDKWIYAINISMIDNLIFISRHVMDTYNNYEYKLLLTERPFVKISTDISCIEKCMNNPTIFFFGRYLPYKNLDLFYELSKNFPKLKFYIYSYGCPEYSGDNLTINNSWISENEVDEIYKKHQILILPYTETSQSGPLYLGLENNNLIIAPEIKGFQDYSNNLNVFLYSPNNIEMLTLALKKLIFNENLFK